MMYLAILKHLFFNIEVTLPLWCLLFLPQMRIAKTISSPFKHFLKRFLSFSFPCLHYYFFFLLWKADVLKLQATGNQQYMLKGWNLIFMISWSNEKCSPVTLGHEVGTYVVTGPGETVFIYQNPCTVILDRTFLTSATLYLLIQSKINMKSILTASHSIGFTPPYKIALMDSIIYVRRFGLSGWQWALLFAFITVTNVIVSNKSFR